MSRTFKQFFLFIVLLAGFASNRRFTVHALLADQSGFISIDCGLSLPENSCYAESTTSIIYVSDVTFVDTGESHLVQSDYRGKYQKPYDSLRSFPQGIRNCYKINVMNGTKYLIRASFLYGNYDGQQKLPEFQLYLGPDLWGSLMLEDASNITNKEVIHVPLRNYIHVCLVNTGSGIPFISALELRPLSDSSYQTTNGSLELVSRYDTGQTGNGFGYRYPMDIHDRFWYNFEGNDWRQLNTKYTIDSDISNIYEPPSVVMRSAATPQNPTDSLSFSWLPSDNNAEFHIWMHFAEVEKLQPNQSRLLYITKNGERLFGPFAPEYLSTTTIFSITAWSIREYITLSIMKTDNSTLPPILNAFEMYMVKKFSESEANQQDVEAITNIKSTYRIQKNWQGDPCTPQKYSWEGVKCSYQGNESPRIISLNLSSSGLTGEIAPSISNLTMLQTLDLSNNNLTGQIPYFLSQIPNLNVLLCGNPNLHKQVSCKKEDNIIFPVAVSTVGTFILIFSVVAISWGFKRKRQHKMIKNFKQNGLMESQGERFTYSEIVKITNNFASMIGSGGFGKVYHGTLLKNEIQVAVKLLTSSSRQGSKEFQNEVQLLMRAHHRNLVSLVGYCDEGETMALVYEYVANGNLQQILSADVTTNVLTWKERLQIAVDAARGLDYLHNGCKPPIVHRDLKTSNILLNEKLQAKIADFGLSRGLGTESVTHVSTGPKGTFGYLDPEYFYTGSLNKKSDIYSFGIVLLELITGREAIIKDVEALPIHICQWVSPKFESTEIENIVDSRIQGTYNISSAWKAIEIAMACLLPTAIQRPDIIVVYNNLKECLEIEMPSEIWKIMENNENDSEGNIDDTSSNSSIIMASHIEIETERHTT